MTVPHYLKCTDPDYDAVYRKGITKCPYCNLPLCHLRDEFGCGICMIWWDAYGNLWKENVKEEEDMLVPEGTLLVMYENED